jgi:hypothetical protein
MKLRTVQYLDAPATSSLVTSDILLSILFFYTLNLYSSLTVRKRFTPIENRR